MSSKGVQQKRKADVLETKHCSSQKLASHLMLCLLLDVSVAFTLFWAIFCLEPHFSWSDQAEKLPSKHPTD